MYEHGADALDSARKDTSCTVCDLKMPCALSLTDPFPILCRTIDRARWRGWVVAGGGPPHDQRNAVGNLHGQRI